MDSDGHPILADDPPESSDQANASRGVPRGRRLLDLMAAVATCSLLFAAYRSLYKVLDEVPQRHLATLATGMLLILSAAHALLTALRRRHDSKGLTESLDLLLVAILVIGLLAAFLSAPASPAAGALYLAATLVILTYAMRRP
jgi:hypothetical protein